MMAKRYTLNVQQLFELQDLLIKLKRKAEGEMVSGISEALIQLEQIIEGHRLDIESKRSQCVSESSRFEDIREALQALEDSSKAEVAQYDAELKFYR
jgi:hypothetical protein